MMQHLENQTENNLSNKSNVAWYKLAELINRGEKEKALSFYRLLSHSFNDRAYVLQLEGDMLWAFEDRSALQKYQEAAFLYRKENKLSSAAYIYEHLLILEPGDYDFLSNITLFYVEINSMENFKSCFADLLNLYKRKKFSEEIVVNLVENVFELCKDNDIKLECVKKYMIEFSKIMPDVLLEKINKYLN